MREGDMLVLPYRRSKTDYDTPAMKVFTVGLDQKPPVKSPDSPPPGYPSPTPPAGIKMPLPLGPEVAPVIVKKSRGYKGILMVMLAVFLMALFALTLSEIAYNRQRDENFFRLRWAELKHRMGYPEPPNYDYYRRLDANRIYELNRNKELAEPLVQQPQETSTSTVAPPQPEQMVIDSESRQQSGSQEQDQGSTLVRDVRLQFLRTILQKIKQHAEAMGLEGTMQVSVIEVDPEQLSAENARQAAGGKPQPRVPFMPHDPKSDSFLDGFGEYHQPTFMENNQIAEQNRQRAFGPWPREQESSQDVDFPGRHGPYRPEEMSFRPFRPEWAMPPRPFAGEHNEVEQPPMPPMSLGPIVEPPMPQQKVFELERPQEIVGEMYGRKFGRMLQDLIASRLQGMQQMQLNPLMPQRPSFPIENSIIPQQAQQQQQGPPMMPPNTWWQQPPPQWQRQIGQGVDFFPQPPQNQQQPQGGPQQQQQMPQVVFFPPPPPPVQPQQMQQQSQEQQPQPVPQQAQQFPQPQNLIPPEDRIQIEPPNQGGPKIQGVIAPEFRPWPEAANAEPKQPKEEKMNNEGPRGWTHQEQPASPPNWVPLPMPGDLNIQAGRVTGEAVPAVVDRDTEATDAQKEPEKKETEKSQSEKSDAEKPQKPETITEEEDSAEPLEMVQTPVVSGGTEGAAPSSDEEKWKQLLAKAAMENAQRQQQSRISTLPLQEAAIQINPLPPTVELHPAVMAPRTAVAAEKQSESQEPKEAPVKGEAVAVEFPKFRVEAAKEVEPVQVDFPAVKLPLPAMNDGEATAPQEQPDSVVNEPHAEAPPMQPHEQQHDSPMVQSNPIFFQVDEPFAAAKA